MKLISVKEVCEKMGISPPTFYRHRGKLILLGLREVKIGHLTRIEASSVEQCIQNLIKEREKALCG